MVYAGRVGPAMVRAASWGHHLKGIPGKLQNGAEQWHLHVPMASGPTHGSGRLLLACCIEVVCLVEKLVTTCQVFLSPLLLLSWDKLFIHLLIWQYLAACVMYMLELAMMKESCTVNMYYEQNFKN